MFSCALQGAFTSATSAKAKQKRSLFQLTSLKILRAVFFLQIFYMHRQERRILITDPKETSSAEHLVLFEHGYQHCSHLLEIEGQTSTGRTRSSILILKQRLSFELTPPLKHAPGRRSGCMAHRCNKIPFLKIPDFKLKILDYNSPV